MKWTATGENWFLGFGEVRNGKAYLVQEKEPLLCPRVFALYLPSHSLIQADDRNAEFILRGKIFPGASPKMLPTTSLMFTPATWSLPVKPGQVVEFMAKSTQKFPVDILKNPSYLVQKAKGYVDELCLRNASARGIGSPSSSSSSLRVPELAFKLKTNPASLSREFKTRAGISLLEYHELVLKSAQKIADLSKGNVCMIQAQEFSLMNAQPVE